MKHSVLACFKPGSTRVFGPFDDRQTALDWIADHAALSPVLLTAIPHDSALEKGPGFMGLRSLSDLSGLEVVNPTLEIVRKAAEAHRGRLSWPGDTAGLARHAGRFDSPTPEIEGSAPPARQVGQFA